MIDLSKSLKFEFIKPGEDLEKLLIDLSNMHRICIVEVRGKEFLVYVEEVSPKKE